MSAKEQLLSIIVKNPDLQLNPGDVCFFQAKASIGTPREEITTTTKTKPGLGIGFGITKHFGIGIGRQKVTTTTESHTVWDKEPCTFFVLGDRFVLKLKRQNVFIDYDTVTDLKVNKDALTITTGSRKCYLFMPHRDVERFIQVYTLIGKAGQEGVNMKNLLSDDATTESVPDKRGTNGTYAQTIFLWCVGRKATAIMKRDEYPRYLFYDCNIQNAPKYHREMIEKGYLEDAPIEGLLSTLKLSELKQILQENGFSASGKKADLISSIVANVPQKAINALFPQKKYVLSPMGKAFLEENADYVKLKEHPNWQITPQEYDAAKGANGRFYDVCWGILNKRIMNADNLVEHRNIYYNMYTLLKEEGKNQNAAEMLLRVLYYDVNSLSSGYLNSYRHGYIKKREFLEKAAQEVFFAPGILKDIGDMEEYYSDEMIHRLYSHKGALQPCSEKLFAEIVHSILEGNFDEDYYKQKIIMDYRKA